MRLIFGFGKRFWMYESTSKVVRVDLQDSGKSEDEPAVGAEDVETSVGMDPHGTLSAHTEISGSGIDLNGWRFGFSAPVTCRGSEE
jgi:hypothetical protein